MKNRSKRSLAIYAVIAWMIVNAVFFLLEVTAIGDYIDLNNSIEFVLFTLSIAGLLSMRKWGATLATFTLVYTFAFNTFNVIYYQIYLLNGTSAILNAAAALYMFRSTFANMFT